MNQSSSALTEQATWRDYLELCKPNVVALMLLTSVIGMLLATQSLPTWEVMVLGNLGIGLMSASAAVINHVVDRHIDIKMARTRNRPVAQGKLDGSSAILFAAVLGVVGMAILLFFINALTAWLTLASLIGYAFIYTMYLKRATPQNIVIGGIAGAAPPLLGWTASTGEISGDALLLVLIIFAWTPPHFWALAIHRKEEYASVGIPMLPVTHGVEYTKLQIFLYTLILFAITIFPYLTGMSGELYLVCAVALGLRFIQWALRMMRNHHEDDPINTFKFSITYLMVLFLALLVDHYLQPFLPSLLR